MKKLTALMTFLALAFLVAFHQDVMAYGAAGVSRLSVYTTDNVASLVITGFCDQFGTCGTPSLTLNGSTSGASVLKAPATGGGTVTFFTGSDTVAGLGQNNTYSGTATFSSTATFNGPEVNNGSITLNGPVAFASTIATQGTVFSTQESGNPLVQQTVQLIPVASVNATGGYAFISGVASRKIYPGIPVVTANGTAAGATSVVIACSGGNTIATFPIAGLVNNVPVTPFSSTGAISAGIGFASGCGAGDSVFISRVGSTLTTTTTMTVNMPYTVQ